MFAIRFLFFVLIGIFELVGFVYLLYAIANAPWWFWLIAALAFPAAIYWDFKWRW